jgi:hypothetical protein
MSHRNTDTDLGDSDDPSWEEDALDESMDDDEPCIACPHCQKQIHEDSQWCPYCENYISSEDVRALRKPWFMIIGVGLSLYIIFRWIVG